MADENVTAYHVTGDFRHVIEDGIVDLDALPDAALPTGHVTFTPLSPMPVVAGVPAKAYTLAPYKAMIVAGRIEDFQGRDGVWLAGEIGVQVMRWRAEVYLEFRGMKIPYPDVEFDLASDSRLTGLIQQTGPGMTPIVLDPRIEALAASVEAVNLAVVEAEGHASTAADQVPLAKAEADRAIGLANAQDEHIAGVLGDPQSATHAAFKAVGDATYETRAGAALTYTKRGTPVLAASEVRTWGHSFMAGVTQSIHAGELGMAPLLAGHLNLPLVQRAVGGTALYSHLSADAHWGRVLQTETRGQAFVPRGGVYAAMYGLNDLNQLGNTVEAMRSFTMALRSTVARFRASAVFENDHESVVLAGASAWNTFPVTVSPAGSGDSVAYNATSGGTITITTPADFPGGTITLGFANWSDGGGGTVTGTVNGETYSVDTKAVSRTDAKTPAILRIPNVPAGSASYTFTTSNVSGGIGVMFDYWQWEPQESQCPLVALVGQPKPLDYTGYGAGGSQSGGTPTDAGVDALNEIQQSVAAEFGERVVFVPPAPIDKDPAYWSPGNVHPNLAGHALIAEGIANTILDEAAFLVTELPDPVSVSSAPTAPSDPSRISWGTAAPTSGTYERGDVRFNSEAAPGVRAGWICTASGTPGTWSELPSPRIGTGQAILRNGVATVTGLSGIKGTTEIRLWQVVLSGTPGAVYVASKTSTVGFTIHSTSSTDNSTIGWEVLRY